MSKAAGPAFQDYLEDILASTSETSKQMSINIIGMENQMNVEFKNIKWLQTQLYLPIKYASDQLKDLSDIL